MVIKLQNYLINIQRTRWAGNEAAEKVSTFQKYSFKKLQFVKKMMIAFVYCSGFNLDIFNRMYLQSAFVKMFFSSLTQSLYPGTHSTKARYGQYQSKVSSVPKPGIVSTKARYGQYQSRVV